MKVKNHCTEYDGWKTENQWLKEGLAIVDKRKAVELWSNQFCKCSSLYASPENVRPMTSVELEDFKKEQREKRKKAEEERKKKKEIYARKLKYADELRENWHTEWQWLREYHRIVNDGANIVVGKTLNERIGRDWCVFGSDYCYFNIKDTILITDEKEYQRLIDESNKKYCGEK